MALDDELLEGSDALDLTVGAPGRPEVDEALDDALGADEGDFAGGPLPPVDEEQVKRVLRAIGGGLGTVLGDEDVPEHWHFTEAELDGIAPPLCAAINRSPRIAQAVHQSDTAVVVAWLGAYGIRNVQAGARARRAREGDTDHGDEPGEARPAQGPAGPPAGGGPYGPPLGAAPDPARGDGPGAGHGPTAG